MKSALVVVALAVITGCSSAGSDPAANGGGDRGATHDAGSVSDASASDCEPDLAAKLCITARVSGRVTHQGTTSAPIPALTCAAWAQGQNGKLRLPTFYGTVDGAEFGFGASVTDYKGVASYGLDSLAGIGTGFIVTSERPFEADAISSAKLTIAADGSGTIEFKDFIEMSDKEPRPAAESGSISWTCVDPKADEP